MLRWVYEAGGLRIDQCSLAAVRERAENSLSVRQNFPCCRRAGHLRNGDLALTKPATSAVCPGVSLRARTGDLPVTKRATSAVCPGVSLRARNGDLALTKPATSAVCPGVSLRARNGDLPVTKRATSAVCPGVSLRARNGPPAAAGPAVPVSVSNWLRGGVPAPARTRAPVTSRSRASAERPLTSGRSGVFLTNRRGVASVSESRRAACSGAPRCALTAFAPPLR